MPDPAYDLLMLLDHEWSLTGRETETVHNVERFYFHHKRSGERARVSVPVGAWRSAASRAEFERRVVDRRLLSV